MKHNKFEDQFKLFIEKKRSSQNLSSDKTYMKDKVSRVRKLLDIFSVEQFLKMDEDQLLVLTDSLIEHFSHITPPRTGKDTRYKDYVVVLRLVYEMINQGKTAPKYTHYAGRRVKVRELPLTY